MVSYLEIIDSAVKIGLGALIAAFSSYLLAKHNHSRDLEKDHIRRKRELLESVAEQVEGFTHLSLRYWAFIGDWIRSKRDSRSMSENRSKDLERTRDALFDSFKEVTSGEAKLLLLGLKKPQQALRAYGEVITELRKALFIGGPLASEEELQLWRSRLLSARELFFQELSDAYQTLRP
ncbi:hypothetical protein Q9Q94_09450 [Uliginosibacterium sp. 31-16]|uniref:hypothetical protein n=1 Tax=Uliginosibacterium sp. 31-16 TaxID=3068315 RepID=UPI00273FC88B|nr:hypothetical protein [Uliginosibacterium sp. 31-16]MDP5239756.1 hypothetical protein [Uliginosibacterium sp. 31-16]